MATIRIATRSSRLALWQAEYVAGRLQDALGLTTEIVEVSTLGDRNRRDSLADFGGMGVFTREVQTAVLDGDADIAVHSLKDLPTDPTDGLLLASFPVRASRFDLLLLPQDAGTEEAPRIETLPQAARVGTGSPRRRAQLLRARPDLRVLDIRGNIDTRLKKLDDGEYDAIILAEAGVNRLGFESRVIAQLRPPEFYPAVGQGALGVECRVGDETTRAALAAIDDAGVRAEVTAERAALRELRAGCHAPLGAYCETINEQLRLTVIVFRPDGQDYRQASETASHSAAEELGMQVARAISADGGDALLGSDTTPE